MAIKGKGRTRGRRAVAAPPKRTVVVPKPPIWRRRWVWLAVALVAVAGILTGVQIAVHAHGVSARKDREERAMRAYLNQFQLHLPADRTPVPPDVIVIFSSVGDDLSAGNGLTAAQMGKKGIDVADMASKSADGLEKVPVARLIPSEFQADRTELNEAQFLVAQAYHLYEQVGALLQSAAGVSGDQRQVILDQVQILTNRSGALFDRGYAKIVRIAQRLGIPVETTIAPPQVPPGNVTPAPTPAPTATASATTSPSASPSA